MAKKKKLTKAQRTARNQQRKNSRTNQRKAKKANPNPQPTARIVTEPELEKPDTAAPSGVVDQVETGAAQKVSTEQCQAQKPDWWRRVNWDLVFSACLVAFAGATMIVGYWQWDVMVAQNAIIKAQVKQTDESLRLTLLSQCACVTVGTPTMTGFDLGQETVLTYGLENTGEAPARILSIKGHAFFTKSVPEAQARLAQIEKMEDDQGGGLIPPGGISTIFLPEEFDAKDIEHTKAKLIRLVVIIDIRYTDQYHTIGRSRQLFYYNVDDDSFMSHLKYGIMEMKLPEKNNSDAK